MIKAINNVHKKIIIDVLQGFKYTSVQPAFNCSKLTIETIEQDMKYVQS